MNWFGPSNGSCTCCGDCPCGYVEICQCCEDYQVKDRPDVTFTLGGSIGSAQDFIFRFPTCPAATPPSGVLGDYVHSCGDSNFALLSGYLVYYFYSTKMCTSTWLGETVDVYHEITVLTRYPENFPDSSIPALLSCSVFSTPIYVPTGVIPDGTANNVNNFFIGESPSFSIYEAEIAACTCRPLVNETVSSFPGFPNDGQIDVSGVTITATLAT